MKLSNLFYLGALSALVLTGCKDNDDNSEWMTDGVVFTSHIEGMVSRASGSAWSDGDKVGIYMNAGGTDFENYEYTASADGALTAAGKTLKYPEEGTADFFAYYPYQTSISNKTYAVNVSDQSDPTKIDLLYATKTGISNGEAVNFAFSHQLSQIVINVSHDETIANLNGLKIQVKGMNTQASFALADGTLTSTDSKADFDMNVNAEGTTAEAIVIPTADLTGAELVFTLADGKSFGWDLTQSDVSSFDKGTKYTYNASLSMTNGQPSADMGNATIDDWTTKPGGDINVDFGEGTQTGGEVVVLDEPFADGPGDFTINDVTKPNGSGYVWSFDDKGPYMKASAFISGTDHASESWLISPEIDLTQATTATLSFMHIINYTDAPVGTYQTLWVTEASNENWQQVTIPNYPAGTSWEEVSSGDIDLSAFAGKTIKIGFKYTSIDGDASTWEVYNVKVVANDGSGTVDPNPDPEPTPGEETIFFTETFGSAGEEADKQKISAWNKWDNSSLTFSDATSTADVRSIAHKTVSNPSESAKVNNVWFPANKDSELSISGINTNGFSKFQLSYEAAANVFNSGTSIDLNKLTVKFNGQTVTIPSQVVSKDNNDANVFYPIEVTFEATGTDNSTLLFSVLGSENTVGLRLYNVKLIGLK